MSNKSNTLKDNIGGDCNDDDHNNDVHDARKNKDDNASTAERNGE